MDEAYNENQTLLLKFFHSRDINLRNQIIEANLGLVRIVAYKMTYYCETPLDDLIQIGSYGLIKAVDRYDPQKRRKLSSFAIPFIKGSILQFLRDKERNIRIPRKLYETYQQLKKHSQLNACTYSEAAIALQINSKLAADAYTAWNSCIGELPLHLPATEPEDSHIPYDVLTTNELVVISLLYFEEKSIKGTAQSINITSEQVVSLRDKALDKLRVSMTESVRCPKCQSLDTSRNGKRNGKQSYVCKSCKYQFVLKPLSRGRRGYSDRIRVQVLEAINQGRSYYWCETYLGIDHATAHYWSKKYTIKVDENLQKILSRKVMTKPQQKWQIIAKFNTLADWLSKNCTASQNLDVALDLLNKSMQQITDTDSKK